MEDYIDPDSYDRPREYGHDNWRMAYQWYDISRKMVEDQGFEQHSGDALFYMRKPSQLRNQAGSLKDEFRSDEIIQEVWRDANEEWIDYGKRQIVNTQGVMTTMEGMVEYAARIEKLRDEIDSYVPEGTREKFTSQITEEMNLTDEQRRILDLPPEQRTDEEAQIAAQLVALIFDRDRTIDLKIIAEADEKDRLPAKRLVEQAMELLRQIYSIRQQDSVNNYRYWRERTETEASELALQARRIMYDANEVRQQSIFDDEYEYDYKTKEKKLVQKGAITLYEEAFAAWKKVFDEFPDMQVGDLGDTIVEEMKKYEAMLKVSGIEWPEDFPMQEFINVRARNEQGDELPTSQDVADRRADREEAAELENENAAAGDAAKAGAKTQTRMPTPPAIRIRIQTNR